MSGKRQLKVNYSGNRESLFFWLDSREREKFPRGSRRMFVAFREPNPNIDLLSGEDRSAISFILTRVPSTELDIVFEEV